MHLPRAGLTLIALLAISAAALAHTDGRPNGTPKSYCENLKGDIRFHDYGPQVMTAGFLISAQIMDGNLDDCNGDGLTLDYDGHSEWGVGGARLLADNAGAPYAGAMACYGETAHHGIFPQLWVFDETYPAFVMFAVGVDKINLVGPDPTTGIDCGDQVDDAAIYCMDVCSVPFGPGIDGAYHIYVINDFYSNGQGHIAFAGSSIGHIFD